MNKGQRFLSVAAIVAGSFAVVPPAKAGSISLQTIANITVSSTNANGGGTASALLTFSTSISNPPACDTIPQNSMAIDISSSKGRAMLNTAMSAFLAGRTVSITGQGNCFTPGSTVTPFVTGVETLHAIVVFP